MCRRHSQALRELRVKSLMIISGLFGPVNLKIDGSELKVFQLYCSTSRPADDAAKGSGSAARRVKGGACKNRKRLRKILKISCWK
jgi:hypothetical protein